jgi:hypothetical protein
MKMLSDQLNELSERSKKTEEVLTAVREKNREKLVNQRARLQASIADGNARAQERAAGAKGKAEARWSDMRASVQQRFASINDEADRRRVAKGVKKAQRHADRAERVAADAVSLAMYVLDQAEFSIVDAASARADADDLALQS